MRIKSHISTVYFCPVMFDAGVPSEVTLRIFGFTVFKTNALMRLLEQLGTFYKDFLCVIWRCRRDLRTSETGFSQKESELKHKEHLRWRQGKC